jgi:hypothetical protein
MKKILKPIEQEALDLKMLDAVVKNVGIKLLIEYFASAAWLGDDIEDDTRHLVESFSSNIAEDAMHLVEKVENGEMEELSQMICDLGQKTQREEFVEILNEFTCTNLPNIKTLTGEAA